MATPEEIKKQKELNDLLEQENRLLKRKLELQSESYDLSSTLVEDLKETLGIQSRRSVFESGVLDINKKINRAIRDQRLEFEDIEDIQKQISRNANIINKAGVFQTSLENQLKSLGEDKIKKDENRIQNINEYNQKVVKQRKQLDDILSLSKDERDLRKDEIKELNRKISKNEQLIQGNFKNLSFTSKQFYLTQKQKEELEKINNELRKEEERREAIQKQLGVFGGALKGLERIPVLRNLGIDFKKISEEARNTTENTKSGVEGLKAGFGELGRQFKNILTNEANIFLFIITQIGKAILDVDKQTGDLAKGFNITYNEALNLRDELYAMARDSGELTANTKAYQETILAIGKSLGSNAVLNSKDLKTFTMLRDAAGLTNEELTEMQKLTYVSGINLEDNVGNLLASAKITGLNNKVLLNEKDIMRDVAKTSKAIQLSLGGQGKSLGEAVAQVKILGMNMKQVEDISSSLLNFEQSIASELEAELLTGKDLNLERARMYAINNDMAGVAREIRKNYGDTAEFAKMNRIQQEAAAKAVGMSREDLAATLTDEKALTGLSGEKRNAAQAALEFARARGMTEAEIGAKTIEDLRNQMSVQEELNKSVEKLKEVFVGIAQIVMPIVSAFASLVGIITQNKYALFALQTVLTGIVMKSIVTAIANIAGMSALAGPILGPALAIVGTGALMTSIAYGQTIGKNVGDMSYDNATGETFIATKEGGLFKPSSNDQIKVGPDVLKDNNNKPIKSSSVSSTIDYNKMAVALAKEINNRAIQVSVEMDGKKVAKGVAEYPTESSNVMSTKVFQIQ